MIILINNNIDNNNNNFTVLKNVKKKIFYLINRKVFVRGLKKFINIFFMRIIRGFFSNE